MLNRLRYLRTVERDEMSAHRLFEVVARRLKDVPHSLEWHFSGRGRAHRDRLARFRGIHADERCVLIANGPSLNRTPFDLIKGETTIGLNRVHLLEEKFGVLPSYAVVSDISSQLQYIADDLAHVPRPKFVNWNGRKYVSGDDFTFFKTTFRPRFSRNFPAGIYGGHSVTYAALQLAYHMGFAEVILVGKDHSYHASGTPTAPIVSDGKESNHFASGYYAPGQMWRVPDYKGEEFAYMMARNAFEADGRRIIDATVDGRLDVFPKMSLAQALGR